MTITPTLLPSSIHLTYPLSIDLTYPAGNTDHPLLCRVPKRHRVRRDTATYTIRDDLHSDIAVSQDTRVKLTSEQHLQVYNMAVGRAGLI